MSATKRESWGSLRKLPSGRWQARYPGPDGETYTARTEDDKSLTFLTKTDARRWLAAVHTKISLGQWEPPAVVAARVRADAEQEQARSMGFEEYSKRWLQMIRTEPNRSDKMRAVGTVRSYAGKVTGYLVPEFGDTPVKEIDADRIREMTDRLDQIPAPLNPKSKFNRITRPVLIVLMMILRQAAREGIIPAAPNVSIPRQESVRYDADHDESEDVITPIQVEAQYEAVPNQWAIMVQLAAWCQLRRGECLGTVFIFPAMPHSVTDQMSPIRAAVPTETGWLFGRDQQTSSGSLHPDIWRGTATDLASKEAIVVYPVAGWWKNRPKMDQSDQGVNYSLVVSIEAPEVEVDLWAAVEQQIRTVIEV